MYELADYTATITGREFFTGPIPDAQFWDTKHNAWNAKHHAIKRVSDETFALVGQGQNTGTHIPLSAKQAAMFISHNEDLWYNSHAKDRGPDPLGYAEFALHMHSFDQSGDLWAYYDPQERRYIYPQGDDRQCEIPSWGTWLVFPQHIGEYRVRADQALVSKERKEFIDRQWERNLMRQDEARRKRDLERQARSNGPYPKRNRNDMRAAIAARSQEAADGVRAVNAAANLPGNRNRRNRGTHASAATPVQAAPPAPVLTTPAAPVQAVADVPAHHAPTPAQIIGAAPVQSTASHIPPITTIDPAHFSSHDSPDPLADPLATLTNEEFMEMLENTGPGQPSSEDALILFDSPLNSRVPDYLRALRHTSTCEICQIEVTRGLRI
ncbi:hypothetical protein B0H11DRAFT_1934147 [Mycena galericulata]|nr:hypothetical protein B0H11DRAFT_1934147 [Mycena galericulata]